MVKLQLIVACVILSVAYSNAEYKKTLKLPPEVARIILQSVAKCLTDVGVSVDALDSARDGKYGGDKSFKKFVHCSFKKAGYLDKNERLNVEKALAIFPNEPEMKAAIEKCSKIETEDKIEYPFKFIECYSNTSTVHVVA